MQNLFIELDDGQRVYLKLTNRKSKAIFEKITKTEAQYV